MMSYDSRKKQSKCVKIDVTNKSCLICDKSEKYAFLVTLRSLVSMRRGEVEVRTYINMIGKMKPSYIGRLKFNSVFHHLLSINSKQLYVLHSTARMYPQNRYFRV